LTAGKPILFEHNVLETDTPLVFDSIFPERRHQVHCVRGPVEGGKTIEELPGQAGVVAGKSKRYLDC
jgi:hypothetical protein